MGLEKLVQDQRRSGAYTDMKATKYSVKIEIEVLDMESVPALVYSALEEIKNQFHDGELTANDGDYVLWDTEKRKVEF